MMGQNSKKDSGQTGLFLSPHRLNEEVGQVKRGVGGVFLTSKKRAGGVSPLYKRGPGVFLSPLERGGRGCVKILLKTHYHPKLRQPPHKLNRLERGAFKI